MAGANYDVAFASKYEINIPGYTENLPIFSIEELSASVEVIASNVGNKATEQLSCPQTGPRQPGNVVITALANTDSKVLFEWFNKVNPVNGMGSDLSGNLQPPNIVISDASENPILTVDMIDAYPFSVAYEGLDSKPSAPVKIKMTIACSDIDCS